MGDFLFCQVPMLIFVGMRILIRIFLICCGSCIAICAGAQTLGGQSAFSFLRLSSYPLMNALGGANTSVISDDPTTAAHNPALLRSMHHGQMTAAFNAHPAGMRQLGWMMTSVPARWGTIVSGGIDMFDYGTASQTDAAGNILGDFSARDIAVRVSAGGRYLEHWHGGVSLKGAFSRYGIYRSGAVLADVGLNYHDSAQGFQAGILFRNMGAQWRTYDQVGEDMPFDVQLGVTKRLKYAPLQFSLTAHRLHRFDLLYRDTLFIADNGWPQTGGGFAEKLLRHMTLSVQGFVGERIDLAMGYSFMRRGELSIPGAANGLAGFSLGAGVGLRRLKFRYARSVHRPGAAFSQFSITADLSRPR
jgi:hypothetical protein